MITLTPFASTVTPITWEGFVKLIPIKNVPHRNGLVWFNACVCMDFDITSTAEYVRKITHLAPGDAPKVLLNQIYGTCEITHLYKDDLTKMIEDQTAELCVNFGDPTHLVHLNSRTWLIANPDDFKVYTSDKGTGLANLFPIKNRIVIIDKITQVQLDAAIAKFLKG